MQKDVDIEETLNIIDDMLRMKKELRYGLNVMKQFLDNKELEELMNILKNMEDEELAVQLLAELNKASKELGLLVMNTEAAIKHEEWERAVRSR